MTQWTFDGITVEGLLGENFGEVLGQTYTVAFAVRDNTNYVDLRDYARFAEGHVDTGTGDNGRPWYRETLPAEAQVSSVIVPIEPGADIRTTYGDVVRGVWGAVVDATDPNRLPEALDFEFEIFALGYVDSAGGSSDPDFYSSRSEIETELREPFTKETV